jgi:hypothetical protein
MACMLRVLLNSDVNAEFETTCDHAILEVLEQRETYSIPLSGEVRGTVNVRAVSPEDALGGIKEHLDKVSILTELQYVEDSLALAYDDDTILSLLKSGGSRTE